MANMRRSRGSVEHKIEIAASASAVWDVLAELDRWGEWNPLYKQASGTPVVGSKIAMTIALEGMKPQKAVATIVAVEPAARLEYQIVNLGGLIRAFRYITLRDLGPDRCEVINGEIMSGLVGSLLSRVVGEKVGKGLKGMNRALRAKLEA